MKWSRATIRVISSTLDPQEIGEQLQLQSTRSHCKGDLRRPGRSEKWLSSLWSLDSPLDDQRTMTDHLTYLLDLLEPRKELVKELSQNARVELFCGFSSDNGQGGFELDTCTLCRLAAVAVPLALDLYPPGPFDSGKDSDQYEMDVQDLG
jgi:uncharacterized protein DUF4279